MVGERKLLSQLSNPFIVNLLYAYQTENELCMVVDLMLGGDVRFHLTKETYFDEERVKFYAASVVLGKAKETMRRKKYENESGRETRYVVIVCGVM